MQVSPNVREEVSLHSAPVLRPCLVGVRRLRASNGAIRLGAHQLGAGFAEKGRATESSEPLDEHRQFGGRAIYCPKLSRMPTFLMLCEFWEKPESPSASEVEQVLRLPCKPGVRHERSVWVAFRLMLIGRIEPLPKERNKASSTLEARYSNAAPDPYLGHD